MFNHHKRQIPERQGEVWLLRGWKGAPIKALIAAGSGHGYLKTGCDYAAILIMGKSQGKPLKRLDRSGGVVHP
ncbi:MAG: hypothetical protein NT167_31750, partial [Verrucomicrobia bacterium]|nr:hypothetical protein [Verrucomicrobiota bacterium]